VSARPVKNPAGLGACAPAHLNPSQGFDVRVLMACLAVEETFCFRQRVNSSFTTKPRKSLLLGSIMVNKTVITPNQLRAARAWLSWSRGKLTLKSGVSERAIARYEQGLSVPHDETLARLKEALEAAGIQFQFIGAMGTGIGIVAGEDRTGAC